MRLRLLTLRAQHEHLDRASDIGPAIEHGGHLRSDRQLDAVPGAERKRGARRLHPFRDHFHARENLGKRTAARQFDPDMPIAAQ